MPVRLETKLIGGPADSSHTNTQLLGSFCVILPRFLLKNAANFLKELIRPRFSSLEIGCQTVASPSLLVN